MPKLKIRLTLALTGLTLCLFAQTKNYRHQIDLKGITNNWHSIPLPDAIFPLVKTGLEDLRIYGIKGTDTVEVPYILEKSANQVVDKEISFQIINQSKSLEGYYFTFEATQAEIINQLRLSFEQRNFDWKVTLAGSNDNIEWFTILTDHRILSVKNSKTDYQYTQLDFQNSKFNYYRLCIKANEQPTINAAKILKSTTLIGLKKLIAFQSFQVINNARNKESTIDITLPHAVPVSNLTLNVQGGLDFYRALKIECATDSFKTDKGVQYHFERVYEGTISSLEIPEFNFTGTLAKRLKITIQNNDNQPLHIQAIALHGPIYELIARFQKTDYHYALYYGNEQAKPPVYELKTFENKIPITMTALTLGQAQLNPAYVIKIERPIFENKAWLWALMGLIVSIIGFFTYKMLKDK